jgi:manganese/zinc/iron transport system permease protein
MEIKDLTTDMTTEEISMEKLLQARSWSKRRLKRSLKQAIHDGLIVESQPLRYRLTETGLVTARRFVRNHRLWEMYLITHADIAPSRVDREADQIEHVLGKEMVASLEKLLISRGQPTSMLASPHPL